MRSKKTIIIFFLFSVFVLILLSVSGAILKHHYSQDKKVEKYLILRKLIVPLAELPYSLKSKKFFKDKYEVGTSLKHIKKDRFKRYQKQELETLLIMSRYDGRLKKSLVEIIDTKNFEVIHSYNFNSEKIINSFDFSRIINKGKKKEYLLKSKILGIRNPLINSDGSLIGHLNYSPIFKLDICSNLIWVNERQLYRHKITKDSNDEIWVGGLMYPYSNYIRENKAISFGLFDDDAVSKISQNGELLYSKSVSEILIENKKLPQNFLNKKNPIYLTDVEPAKTDSLYWKKGDLFISAKNLSAIIHFRPSNNKIINFITGPFFMQHDVNIVSNSEISIFNNNNTLDKSSKFSEVIIYNFEKKSFSKKFDNELRQNNFKTPTSGISRILKDGSLFVEEQVHGRLIFFNNKGEKEWEYLNKSDDGKIYRTNWTRLIEDKFLINELYKKIQNKNCKNK